MNFAVLLNDRYELDIGTPMVMWDVRGPLVELMIKVCSLRRGKKNTNIFKGWKERPVFGKVQYIRCKRKFNVGAYITKHLSKAAHK